MASEEDNPLFPDDDLDDDDNDNDNGNDNDNNSSSSLNGATPFEPYPEPEHEPDPDPVSSSDTDDFITTTTTTTTSAVTLAIPSSVAPSTTTSISAVTLAHPDPSPKKPPAILDDSRRLFQRLWTDEDEIELLQGFLDYTTSRGTSSSGHHHDTAAFYDLIKDKLQLDFNKNQLVEKLRRLKKKYRNVLAKMSSGKEFVFKSPHDQATFELSRKIWTNLSGSYRGSVSGGGIGGGGGGMVDFDDDDHNLNPNPSSNMNAITIAAATPPRPPNSSYVISHINLNNAAAAAAAASPVGGSSGGFDVMKANSGMAGVGGGLAKLSTRKRPRTGKVEDRYVKVEGVNNNNAAANSPNSYVNNVNVSPPLQGMVEETVRNCLSPVLKDLINNAVNGAVSGGVGGIGGGVGSPGFKGVGAIALNAVPLNFSGVNVVNNAEGGMDEKWRKQQILELELYSKRLQLVQDQIKLSLEELRSMERVD